MATGLATISRNVLPGYLSFHVRMLDTVGKNFGVIYAHVDI